MADKIPFDEIKAGVTLSAIIGDAVALKKAGRELRGLCPFHAEKTPSFFVNDAEHFYHCFGCGVHGDVFTWLRDKRGFDATRAAEFLGYANGHARTNGHADGWHPMPLPPNTPEPDLRAFDHVYRYTDPDGRLLRLIARKDANGRARKSFTPWSWGSLDGKIGWHPRHSMVPRGLYNLPSLESDPTAPVVICEGEKAADAAHAALSLPVVTWSGGTAAVHTADWRPLAGREVVIWPDNDIPGRKAASEIAAALEGIAATTRILDVSDLPEKADAADLTPDTIVSRFRDRAERTSTEREKTFPLTWFEDIEPSLEANDFVQGVLMEQSAIVVYGQSNSGKTFWATNLALHIAAAMPWNDRRVEGGGVIYCIMESTIGFRNRVAAWKDREGLYGHDLPFAAVTAGLDLREPTNEDVTTLIATVKEATARIAQPVRLIVIDTLARALAGGDENAPDDMGALVKAMDRIREETKAAVLFIHHSGKDQARGARGHSSLQAAIDTEIEVTVDDAGETRTATVVKQREMKKGDAFAFSLEVVELGANRHGEKVTTCIVIPGDAIPAPNIRLTGHNARAFDILADLISGSGEPGHNGVPAGQHSAPEKWWRDRFYERALPGGADEAKRKAFRRAADFLVEQGIVGMGNHRVWLPRRGIPEQNDTEPNRGTS